MHAGNQYSLKEFIFWTRRDIYVLFFLAAIPTVFFKLLGWHWLAIPWVPIAMIGTAAAFIVGFKNTQTYNRLWEARQIYGAIVNSSRSWGIMARDFVTDPAAQKILIYRHIAWLTALRYQLRESRIWENTEKKYNQEYKRFYTIPEKESSLEVELKNVLSEEDATYVLDKKNRAAQLISLQSQHLKQLHNDGHLDLLKYIELQNMLVNLFDQQGKCERIKNFPYPRQFASINKFFIILFISVVPFGLLNEFQKMGEHFVWLNIPFSMVVCWVFSSMERVGEATENPFEGGANDVPISALSRTIEIDLREMLDEKELPPALQPVNNILM
jgi:ion channel-forming bestrophin family protein